MLDEPFQMVQDKHKAAASVLRLAKATWRVSVSLDKRHEVILIWRGPVNSCRITFKLHLSDVIANNGFRLHSRDRDSQHVLCLFTSFN